MPLRITDETAARNVIEVADGGQRIGVNGAPDSSAIVTIAGVTFIGGNSRFVSGTVPTTAVSPVNATITIGAGGTATISTTVPPVVDSNAAVTSMTSSSFTLTAAAGLSIRYSYW